MGITFKFQSEWELNEHCEDETDTSHATSGSQIASEIRNALTGTIINMLQCILILLY